MIIDGTPCHFGYSGDFNEVSKWIPFARRVFREMVMIGVNAHSKWLNDDVMVHTKKVGPVGFIYIKAGSEIYMDSGVVDLRSVAPANSMRLLNGIIDYSNTMDGLAASKRLLGKLTNMTTLESEPPAEGSENALSFKTDQTNTEQQLKLYLKKLTTARCPASIFTGRMRNWVQARYGRKLSDSSKLMIAAGLPSATPGLEYNGISLTTSTGLYRDADWNYWFIRIIDSTRIEIHKGITETVARPLKASLKAGTITGDDAERAEAYVLAYTYPSGDPKDRQTIWIALPGAYSMGYGWHFNMTGDRADIVHNTLRWLGGASYDNVSTHYRLTFTPGLIGAWSAVLSTVEGPTYWKTNKHYGALLEPAWDDGTLTKFGSTLGPAVYGNAPVYCFYRDDILEVIRYRAGSTSLVDSRIGINPGWCAQDRYSGDWTSFVLGNGSTGWSEERSWSGTFMAIDWTSGSTGNLNEYTTTGQVHARSSSESGVSSWYSSSYAATPMDYDNGAPATIGKDAWGMYSGGGGKADLTYNKKTIGPGNHRRSMGYTFRYDSWSTSTAVNVANAAAIIIPFYDAEAVYIEASTTKTASGTGTHNWAAASNGGVKERMENIDTGEFAECDLMFDGGGAPGGSEPWSYSSTVTTLVVSKLITRAGSFDVPVVPYTNQIISGSLDSVSDQQYTVTSATGDSVYSAYIKTPVTDGYKPEQFKDLPSTYIGHA